MKRIVCEPQGHIADWIFRNIHGGQAPSVDAVIGLASDTGLIAGVAFTDNNGRSIGAHIASVGNGWLTREFLWAIFFYPFEVLGVNKILVQTDSENSKALRFIAHMGFTVEHVIKDAGPQNDMFITSMDKSQCKWLNIKRTTGEQHHG